MRLFERLRGRLRQIARVREMSLSCQPFPMHGGTTVRVKVVGAAPSTTRSHAVTVRPDVFRTMQSSFLPVVNLQVETM